ncbi:MAG TPA: HTH domain-containing protein [Bacteroidales bacterium]|nr:HTH domain-containing protein [Bacteroidales bacterium]
MKIFEYLDRINHMHKLVSRHSTGTPEEFARQLGVSRTSLYELIDELRSRGAPIVYSKSAKTFYYKQPYDIMISCCLRPLSYAESKESAGGMRFFHKILFFRTMQSEISMVTLPC